MPSERATNATGSRVRRTRARVHAADAIANAVITTGGLGVVAAVLGICVYLIIVAGRLVTPGSMTPAIASSAQVKPDVWAAQVDEHLASVLTVGTDAIARLHRLETGEIVDEKALAPDGAVVTAFSLVERGGAAAIGLSDGRVALGSIAQTTRFLTAAEEREAGVDHLAPGECMPLGREIVQRATAGQARAIGLGMDLADPVPVEGGAGAVTLLDYQPGARSEFIAGMREDGTGFFNEVRKIVPLGGGPTRVRLRAHPWAIEPESGRSAPTRLVLAGDGSWALLVWDDGFAQRYDTNNPEEIRLIERVRLVPEGRRITAMTRLIGGMTVVVGDEQGDIHGWFAARTTQELSPDGRVFREAHTMRGEGDAVVSIGVSDRDRTFVAADAAGRIVVRNMTSQKVIANDRWEGAPAWVRLAPKLNEVLFAANDGTLARWMLDVGHAEATFGSLFGKVWYEGEPEPAHVYQSSSGDDAAEAKYGLTPLVYGTLKATVYTMLIAAPLGVLAALFTSEFVGRRTRSVVKPTVEMMASLPSVVLGFLAAIVLAPMIRDALPGVLLSFVLLPLGVALGAHLWLFLPVRLVRGGGDSARLFGIVLVAAVSGTIAILLGPAMETVLFADGSGTGSVRAWLNGAYGTPWPGWFALSCPAMLILSWWLVNRYVHPWLQARESAWGHEGGALAELVKLAAIVTLAILAAWGSAHLLTLVGMDPRHSIFGVFEQRNTLVVSLAMAVAVSPIVYTICEDAMSAVPAPLRSASLAAGATRWQTATRIILPMAGSGIFSACMIGLGRAAGETMIVLMATGNTPVMDVSVFSGMRTLSANIAVELPEAAKGSTHYRVLFLCGLVLFAMTFLVNTIAEVMRRRIRARSAAL